MTGPNRTTGPAPDAEPSDDTEAPLEPGPEVQPVEPEPEDGEPDDETEPE